MVALTQIAEAIQAEVEGDIAAIKVDALRTPEEAQAGQLTVVHDDKYLPQAVEGPSAAIICNKAVETDKPLLIVKDTRKAMAIALTMLYPSTKKSGVHPSAIIDESATLGEGTVIGANVVIMGNAVIGDHCRIDPNVVIYEHTEIGNNVTIYAGAVLGKPGFGFYRDETGYHHIPHVAKLIIGDHVSIGSNVCIDRGCLTDTIIGEGTIVDNLIHIGHNNKIGKHNAFAGQAGTAGSVTMGDNNQVGGQVAISNNVTIGDRNIIMGKAGVTKNLGNEGIFKGFPAQDHMAENKERAALRRLTRKKK